MSEQAKSDDFTEAMWKHMLLVNNKCTEKLNELRAQNNALKKEIAAFPLTCYWLQEQVTCLELQLASSKKMHGEAIEQWSKWEGEAKRLSSSPGDSQ